MIISPEYKYKYYSVKPKNDNTGHWRRIEAISPKDAAEIFAEVCGAATGDKLTVRGVGIFSISVEKIYHAQKV